MEKYHFTYFKFGKDEGEDVINIGVKGVDREKILSFAPRTEKLSIDYYPKTQGNHYWEGEYSEYSAFLEKLFQFAEKEKIKRIRANYSIEIKSDFEKTLFKVSDVIIEKKTAEEIEKENKILVVDIGLYFLYTYYFRINFY